MGGGEGVPTTAAAAQQATPSRQAPPPVPITIRRATREDLPFIYATWTRSVRFSRPFSVVCAAQRPRAERVDTNWFFAAQHALIERLLSRPGTLVLVAAHPEHLAQIYGYCVTENGEVCHWLYVKDTWRGKQVGRRLVEAAFQGRPFKTTVRPPQRLVDRWGLQVEYDSHLLVERR